MTDKQTLGSTMVSLVEQTNQITGLCKHALRSVLRPGSVTETSISSAID